MNEKNSPFPKIGIVVNPRKDNIVKPLNDLHRLATTPDIKAVFYLCTFGSPYVQGDLSHFRIIHDFVEMKNVDLIVTLGGDGTLLRTVERLGEAKPDILGVNLGGLGFLAETPPEKLISHLKNYLNNHYQVDERFLLICENGGQKHYALNDLVFDKAGFARVIQIEVMVDRKRLNSYVSDGLIISTPTGSTGYSLSAGGPIVLPQSKVIVLNPICPHSLTNRPLVISDSSEITVQVFTEHTIFNLFSDGNMLDSFASGQKFTIRKSNRSVRFVKMYNQNFFQTISKKLGWGEDFRSKKRWTYQKNLNNK